MTRSLKLSLVFALAAGLAVSGCARKGNDNLVNTNPTDQGKNGPNNLPPQGPADPGDPNKNNHEVTDTGKEYIYPDVHFAYDDASLDADTKVTLKDIGDHLVKSAKSRVIIEGHCDERGSVEYNQALGERRANSVKEYLTSYGVTDDSRMRTISYGNQRPIDPGHDETAWARNRRAHFVVANQANQ